MSQEKWEELTDRTEVSRTLYDYAHGVDRRDWPGFRDCFCDEVEIDLSSYNGQPPGIGHTSCVLTQRPSMGVMEMGHLFNVDGISSSSMGLFTGLHFNSDYWSSYYRADVDGPSGHLSIYFGFASGYQSRPTDFYIELGALAVRDGDIVPVPEPSTALLLGLGLTGLAAKGRRRNRS